MIEASYRNALSSLPLGGLRFFDSIGSTNDEALAWAAQGAPDLALVLADEQTNGRGRMDRKWYTPRGTALAFSLVLQPTPEEHTHVSRTTGLLAVSLADALENIGLTPQIKWPNDVLLNERKIAGILVESTWMGDHLERLVLGMGVNVLAGAVPPAETLLFPATSLEAELGQAVERPVLLRNILTALLAWRPRLGTKALIKAWEERLVFRGQPVQVESGNGETRNGEILGLEPDGSLVLRDKNGKCVSVRFGEVHLRPLA